MTNSRKDHADLTEEDNNLLLSILAKLAVRMHQIYENQKSPKEVAKKWLRGIKTRKTKASIFILFKTDMNFETPLSPNDFNNLLMKNFVDSPPSTSDLMTDSYNYGTARYLTLNRLSELLSSLEIDGLFSHILGKEKVKRLIGELPERDGGPYSFYVFSSEIKK